jgi:hypothetical protein
VGHKVSPFSAAAVRWSLVGALRRCHQQEWPTVRDRKWDDLVSRFGLAMNLGTFNDEVARQTTRRARSSVG